MLTDVHGTCPDNSSVLAIASFSVHLHNPPASVVMLYPTLLMTLFSSFYLQPSRYGLSFLPTHFPVVRTESRRLNDGGNRIQL